jgi:hypothetical protein
VGLGQLAILVFHHPVYSVGCLVPHRLGNRGRFFRPAPFRDGQRIDEFFLYVGKLCRSRARWRDLRPDSELYDRPVDLVQPADFRDAVAFVFDPALDKPDDGNQPNAPTAMRKNHAQSARSLLEAFAISGIVRGRLRRFPEARMSGSERSLARIWSAFQMIFLLFIEVSNGMRLIPRANR